MYTSVIFALKYNTLLFEWNPCIWLHGASISKDKQTLPWIMLVCLSVQIWSIKHVFHFVLNKKILLMYFALIARLKHPLCTDAFCLCQRVGSEKMVALETAIANYHSTQQLYLNPESNADLWGWERDLFFFFVFSQNKNMWTTRHADTKL